VMSKENEASEFNERCVLWSGEWKYDFGG
jgi:hypothetical protein